MLVLISVLLIIGCKKDAEPCCDISNPECPNYAPCHDSDLPSAKIIMGTGSDIVPKPYFYADSVFKSGITFVSEETDPGIKHTWYLGAETIENLTQLGRSFIDVPRPAKLFITHVIEYEPNLACFPNDDGYDSITQDFYLIDKLSEFQSTGTFRGVREGETDSFDITFFYRIYSQPHIIDPDWNIWKNRTIENVVVNFDNNGDTLSGLANQFEDRLYIAHFNNNLNFEFEDIFSGSGIIYLNGKIELTYTNYLIPNTNVKFIGRKIN